jgi:hypothetical protein
VGGTTIGNANEFALTCASGNAPDVYFTFTAPSTGLYTLDTSGSSFDTVLGVRSGTCGGASLACDNDAGPGTTSLLSVSLSAGQTVIVVVDGRNGSQGSFVLNVN